MKTYEGLFILYSDVDEKAEEKVVGAIKDTITKNKGKIAVCDKMGKRQLGFTIKGVNEGIYYRLEFEIAPKSIDDIKKAYKLNEKIVRELITVKE